MESKTKIIILHAKELIYTGIFVVLGIILILVLIFMFVPKNSKDEVTPTMQYVPGVYSSTITLGDQALNVEVAVDKEHITDVSLKNMNETIETMYPLLSPSLDNINKQLETVDSIDDVSFTQDNQYTNTILKQAVKNALLKAEN